MVINKISQVIKDEILSFGSINTLLTTIIPLTLLQVIVTLIITTVMNYQMINYTNSLRSKIVDQAYDCVLRKEKYPNIKHLQEMDCDLVADRVIQLFKIGAIDQVETEVRNIFGKPSDLIFPNIDGYKRLEAVKWDLLIKNQELLFDDLITAVNADTAKLTKEREKTLKSFRRIKAAIQQDLDETKSLVMPLKYPFIPLFWLMISILAFAIRRSEK